jgi:hypothetical protein
MFWSSVAGGCFIGTVYRREQERRPAHLALEKSQKEAGTGVRVRTGRQYRDGVRRHIKG